MSRTALSQHLVKFQSEEEEMVLSATDDTDREEVMAMYSKTKITTEDMLREYTPAEVRELCERTKVRVQMHRLNTVWDAKRRLDKSKRLHNKSESWVNRMLVKAERRRYVEPYSELEKEQYKDLAACQTKKDNNLRLDRWRRQRERAKASDQELSMHPPLSSSESQSQTAESQAQESPPSNMEPPPAALESQPQSQSDESTLDECLQAVIQPPPPAQPTVVDSEPNLWGIGDQDEVEVEESAEEATTGKDKQPDGVAETQLDSVNWMSDVLKDINSESLSLESYLSTQHTEPEDYECFGTQVAAASTQDDPESQPFL